MQTKADRARALAVRIKLAMPTLADGAYRQMLSFVVVYVAAASRLEHQVSNATLDTWEEWLARAPRTT